MERYYQHLGVCVRECACGERGRDEEKVRDGKVYVIYLATLSTSWCMCT